jgi:hypothetical protein
MEKEYYAHSKEGKPPKDWHRLEDHLKKVAEMAHSFAKCFVVGKWSYELHNKVAKGGESLIWTNNFKSLWKYQEKLQCGQGLIQEPLR